MLHDLRKAAADVNQRLLVFFREDGYSRNCYETNVFMVKRDTKKAISNIFRDSLIFFVSYVETKKND